MVLAVDDDDAISPSFGHSARPALTAVELAQKEEALN